MMFIAQLVIVIERLNLCKSLNYKCFLWFRKNLLEQRMVFIAQLGVKKDTSKDIICGKA